MPVSGLGAPPLFRAIVLGAVILCSLAGLRSVGLAQDAAVEARGHYLLVIDHSGSMIRTIRQGPYKGRTRWASMTERAADFTNRLPDGSNLWGIIFRSKDSPTKTWFDPFGRLLRGDADRREMAEQLKNYHPPEGANNTALYDAKGKALEQAQRLLEVDPLSYVTILVYTDGIDEGPETGTPGSVNYNEGQVKTLETSLKRRFPNFNLVDIYSPGDETIRDAHVVRLTQNRFTKPNLLAQQQATLETGFDVRDTATVKLVGRELSFKVLPLGNTPAPIRVVGSYKLSNGMVPLIVERVPGVVIPNDQDVEVAIQVIYPTVPDLLIVPEGGDRLVVRFQKAVKPEIRDLRPANGEEFPVGREVVFSLSTLSGTQTLWEFDDGESGEGSVVRHRYSSPGKRVVKATVTDPQTGQKTAASIDLTIVELELNLDPLPIGAVPEKEVTLTASAAGRFRRFEWSVNGQTYEGQPRKDGRNGTSLSMGFSEFGTFEVKVTGYADKAVVPSKPGMLTVQETPRFRLVRPSPGETLFFKTETEFLAQVEGMQNVDKVRFRVLEVDGQPLMPEREVSVEAQGRTRRASYRFQVPEGQKRKVRVEAELPAEAATAAGLASSKVESMVELALAAPVMEITALDGKEPRWGKPSGFSASGNVALKDLVWDFGDGAGEMRGEGVMQHTYSAYGHFTVKCRATAPDGSAVTAVPVELNVPVRPVIARGEVLSNGNQLGAEVRGVRLRGTVQLKNLSEGDITKAVWLHNDTPLQEGQSTIVINDAGRHELKLVVEGTPEAGSAVARFQFSTQDPFAFYGWSLGTFGILGMLGRLAFGNSPRKWLVSVEPTADRDLTPGRGNRLMKIGRWAWFKKVCKVPMTLVDRHGGWSNSDSIELRGSNTKGPSGECLWRQKGAPRRHTQFVNAPAGRPIYKAPLTRKDGTQVDLAIRTQTKATDWPANLLMLGFFVTLVAAVALVRWMHSMWM